MPEERKDLAYFLSKAEDYSKKADAATSPLMKGAFEAIVREYMRQAREIRPAPVPPSFWID
jgi:hypothetical protein